MPKKDSVKTEQTLTRRGVITALGVAGVSATGVRSVRAESDGTVEIVVTKRGDEVIRTKKVSEEWANNISKARDIHHNLQEKHRHHEDVADIRLTTGEKRLGERLEGKVRVYTYSGDRISTIPQEANGIGIEFVKYDPSDKPLESCNTGMDDPVSGGWELEESGDNGVWSSASRVTDSADVEYMTTCAHAFDECGDPIGTDVEMEGQKMGELNWYSKAMDFAALKRTDDAQVGGYDLNIDRPDQNPTELGVRGHITESGVADIMSTGEAVYKTGRTTCTTSGEVDEMYVTDGLCDATNDNFVHATMQTNGGDSGSPYYVMRWDGDFNQYYAEMVVSSHKGYESQGIAAYEVTSNTDFRYP